MADKNQQFRQNGDNGARPHGQDYREEEREEFRRAERTAERDLAGRRDEGYREGERDEQGRYYQRAMERSWRGDDEHMERLGRGPEFDRERTRRLRDRGYEGGVERDRQYDGDYTSRTGREEYEHAREGFRDFGVPSRGQGREVRDPYNTFNWSGGFEGRDDRVAGRSGTSYASDETSVPEEEWAAERRLFRPGRGRHRYEWEEEPLTARDVMTRSPRTVHPDAPLRDVAQIMHDENCGVVPVVRDDDRLVGLITDRDMVIRTFRHDSAWTQVKVRDVMTGDVEAVTPDEPIIDVVRLMGRKHIRRVPVVDRGDRLVGVVSMTDIAQKAEHDRTLQDAMVRVARRRSFWSKLWT